ncbi:MAG: hypothetical protein RI535_01810 [Psychroflexus sp.]|nr:hypothetical protein [Psychroflexus sp.]
MQDFFNKIKEKWYFTLIITPFLPYLFDFLISLQYTIILCQFILNIILIYEVITLNNKIKNFDNEPSENDKVIIRDLLNTLDIYSFENNIYKQPSWYGYKINAVKKISQFIEKSNNLSFKTKDEELNHLVKDLSKALEDHNSFAIKKLFNEGKNYEFLKDTKGFDYKQAEEDSYTIDQKAKLAFEKLNKLLDHIKSKNFNYEIPYYERDEYITL